VAPAGGAPLAPPAPPRRTTAPALGCNGLQPGAYTWTVRAVDEAGETSPAAEARGFALVVRAPPGVPALVAPIAGADVAVPRAEPLRLSWRPVPGTQRYEIELAAAEGLGPDVIRQRSAVPEMIAPPGFVGKRRRTVVWRVRAVDDEGTAGPWSTPERFTCMTERPQPSTDRRGPARVELGPRIGLFHNLGEVTTARVAVQARYRPRFLGRRLGASLAVGYYTATATAPAQGSTPAVDSRLHGIPVELVVFWSQSLRVVDAYVGVGVDVTMLRARVSAATQPTWERSGTEVGGLGVVGVERHLGPGLLYAELAYERATRSAGLVAMDPGGIAASLGYRVRVW
jgi:hypothetical protein